MLRKVIADAAVDRAIVFKIEDTERIQGLRISPVRAVEEEGGICAIYYLALRRSAAHKEIVPRRSVNADTDWQQVSRCELGGVLDEILKRI